MSHPVETVSKGQRLLAHLRRLPCAPFTWVMALAMLALFTAAWMKGGDAAVRDLFTAGQLSSNRFMAGEWWLLFNNSFVHHDVDHVLWNCGVLLLVGMAIEPRMGTLRTILVYFTGGIAGNVVMLVIEKHGAGASSEIVALLGAFLARPPRRWRGASLTATGIGWALAAWLTFNILRSGAEAGDIAHEAHLAGLIVGLCLGAVLSDKGPPTATSWPRPLRFASAACVSLGLIVGQVPMPRWSLDWHRGSAIRAERRGDLGIATAHWTAIEEMADPRDCVDAVFIENAARFRLRRQDYTGARKLLIAVAPTFDEARIFRDVGFLLAQHEPTDQRLAARYWRMAASRDPTMPEVLNAIAWSMVAVDNDSTAGRLDQAREMAMRAVALDRRRTPEFMATLAWAEYRCGNASSAIGWMRRAIARDPKDRAAFLADLATLEQE